jgi:alkanesulfonate monooxygenase SsuD/methylene tetrahydromethanopterin reductase-like flavin-dependent oxidoreductase (luciferase family)
MEDRLNHMIDGIELSLALWTSEQEVNFEGRYYRLKAARCEPRPLQQPHPPIWLGNAHPLMLEATARYAQGWNTTPVDLPTLRQHLQALAAACEKVGRPFEALEKSLELQILVTPDLAKARQQLKTMISLEPSAASLDPALEAFLAGETEVIPASLPHNSLVGTPEMIIRQLQAYIQEGISHFMLWFMDIPRQDGLRLFAEKVAPQLR